MSKDESNINHNDLVKITMKKARQKMTIRIIRIVAACFLLIILAVNVPNILHIFQMDRMYESQKMAMLTLEYATPNGIVGYSMNNSELFSFERGINIYYRNYAGHNIAASDQEELRVNYNLLSGKIDMYAPIAGPFLHPDRYNSLEKEYQTSVDENTERVVRSLVKNKDSTVTLLNITFDKTYSIEEVMALTNEYDVEINWFAIETGFEGNDPPSHIGLPAQQYYTWGIPARIYRPENIFNPDDISDSLVAEQILHAMLDMKWMKANKDLVKADRVWFLNEDIESYFNDHGVKCYGIQVNGPTDQVYEMIQKIDYEYLDIEEMSIWFW